MMLNKRAVLLIGNFLSGTLGTRGVSEDLGTLLSKRGWKVIAASNRMNRISRLFDMLTTAYRFRSAYQVANVDVYSGPSFIWAELACCLLLVLGKTVSLTLHGGGLPDFAFRYPMRVKRLLLSVHSVNTPSRYLLNHFTTFRPDILWLPNGITIANYPIRERDFQKPNLVWLRAFHEIYNPKLAVEVFSILRAEHPDCSLTMIGPDKRDGSFTATVALAKRHNVLDYIHFIGPVPKLDVPSWLDKGDIFLNTTLFESFGVSVLEAAACGLPIVSANVGELPYLWRDGVDALLVPSDDPLAMAAAVRSILAEPDLAQRLVKNARQKAEGFDWSIVLPQWEDLLQKLIAI